MKQAFLNLLRAFWIAASDLYFALFFVWVILSISTHGRFAWVNLMNMFAFEVFLFLLPCALAGLIYRLQRLQIASAIAVILFILIFGKFFLPKTQSASAASGSLKVMTYNMLSFSEHPTAVVDVIREEDADIVFMQETNPETADLLQKEMRSVYPYQIHYANPMPIGTSVISKYPFKDINWELGTPWVGKPILLEVDWNGKKINAVNFHMVPTGLGVIISPEVFNKISDVRKDEAAALIEFLRAHPAPTVIAGDMNDVFLNDPHRILVNAGLRDAWHEAGFGLGHTFPGNKSRGTSRIRIGDVYIPEWLVRIDYIFVTPEWDINSAYIARTDGYSDHRPVVVTLHTR